MSALLIVSVISTCTVAVLYQGELQKNSQPNTLDSGISPGFYRTIQRILADNINYSMAPPVNMEDALAIGFGNSGWTDDNLMELNATRVDVRLVYGYVDEAANETVVLGTVPSAQDDYSHFSADGKTQRYMWQIVAYNAGSNLMPRTHDGYCLVDAYTGEVLPIPPS